MAALTLVATAVADVKIGDVIVFGWEYDDGTFHVWDRDVVDRVDGLGVHFAGGTYIAADDHDVLVAK